MHGIGLVRVHVNTAAGVLKEHDAVDGIVIGDVAGEVKARFGSETGREFVYLGSACEYGVRVVPRGLSAEWEGALRQSKYQGKEQRHAGHCAG